MDLKLEQRFAIKFCVRLKKNVTETIEMMKTAFGNEIYSDMTIRRWHAEFSEGRESAFLTPHGGQLITTATDEKKNTIAVAIWEDRHLSVRRMEELLHIPKSSIHRILKDNLGMKRVASTWVPHMLTAEQLKTRVDICEENLQRFHDNPDLLKRIITCDEMWVHHYDPQSKRESEAWKSLGSPRLKKVRQQKSAGKVMLISFFDYRGSIYQHYVPPLVKVNKEYYCSILKTLRGHISHKRPDIKDYWILHQDNARLHTARLTQEWLEKHGIETLPHPPYSPDLAPCDYWLFPTLKWGLRGRQFQTDDEVKKEVQKFFQQTPQAEFEKTILEKWLERMQRCVDSDGRYFEKDPKAWGHESSDSDE